MTAPGRAADATWCGPARLGVGFPYLIGFDAEIYESGVVDFVEITPDSLCRPLPGRGGGVALAPDLLEAARRTCGDLPTVVHGVELSIGSVPRWNDNYVAMLEAFQALWPFHWHSEHLHFQTFTPDPDGVMIETGVPLPLPMTAEAITLVAARAAELGRRFGVPFLLENGAHYFPSLPCDEEIGDEAGFIGGIVERGGCGILLDLHNLHCNAVNHGFDAAAMLDRLRLDRVVEIHLAGGSWREGFRLDAHDGLVPDAVWALLDLALPRCPNVAGLVFEIVEHHARTIGPDAIAGELARLRVAWGRHAPPLG